MAKNNLKKLWVKYIRNYKRFYFSSVKKSLASGNPMPILEAADFVLFVCVLHLFLSSLGGHYAMT